MLSCEATACLEGPVEDERVQDHLLYQRIVENNVGKNCLPHQKQAWEEEEEIDVVAVCKESCFHRKHL